MFDLKPYFGVVIPCLNEENFLPNLLKDLALQTYRDFEVIVVDGKSEDKTVQKAEEFLEKLPALRVVYSEKRKVSFQRNFGAENTTAKVLVFFDADTRIPRYFLAKINKAFETNKYHILSTYFKPDSNRAADKAFALMINTAFELGRLIGIPSGYGAMQIFKRRVFEDIGGYDENVTFAEDSHILKKGMDYNYNFSILPNPKFVYSLRRFRADGMLESMHKYMLMNFWILKNGYTGEHPKYEMGGHLFSDDKKRKEKSYNRFGRLFAGANKLSQSQLKMIIDKVGNLIPKNE